MQRPLIGVTPGEIFNKKFPWSPVVQGQAHTYIDAVIRVGGIPVILPLTKDQEVLDDLAKRLDGLLLSGGNDISPKMYGELPYEETIDTSDLRDGVEKYMLDRVLEQTKPVLAICRGLQFLNVYFGGSLYQDISKDLPNALDHQSSTKAKNLEHRGHYINIDSTSKLYKIMQTKQVDTNTHHHQAVKELAQGLKITARSEDGLIEGLETEDDRFIIAVQSHPESLSHTVPEWRKLFEAFIEASSKS